MQIKSAKDLKKATYNPRTISKKQMDALRTSITTLGDLSGIVFNRRTQTLVSGHQRTDSLKKWPSKAVLRETKDEFGTVQEGHMVYKTDNGLIRVPMRVVDWPLSKEKTANIAANTHGGDFDRQKLATLVAELEKDKQFNLDLIGLDSHDMAHLRKLVVHEESETAPEAPDSEDFESVIPKAQKERSKMVCCPKCNFAFKP